MSTSFFTVPKKLAPIKVFLAFGYLLAAIEFVLPFKANAHGGGGDEPLEVGEFRTTPYVTLEGHHGVENSKENTPTHHGLDGLFGVVMDWGLENDGKFSIEAALGPVFVWGEADHFYGAVHEEEEGEEHEAHDTDFKRTDFRGFLKFNYSPNDRLSFSLDTNPHLVTKNQGEEKKGTKYEIGSKALYKFGDGNVNFALGDQFTDLIDGTYVSIEHRQGWDSDGTWQGQYTDPRFGVEFNYDLISFRLEAGPRFYRPRFNVGLSNRTDFAGELEVSRPIGDNAELFFHWQPTFSEKDGAEWKEAWNHHLGTGVTFRF